MTDPKVVTSQPVPASAPFEEPPPYSPSVLPPPYVEASAPLENVMTNQSMLDENGQEMLTRADAAKSDAEEELRRRRNEDYCCYACADACEGDVFCWYFFWRLYCNCLGQCCEAIGSCTDSCCEGCGSCVQSCCCDDGPGDAAQAGDGCCDGDCCDCGGDCCGDGCDCDCGGCFD